MSATTEILTKLIENASKFQMTNNTIDTKYCRHVEKLCEILSTHEIQMVCTSGLEKSLSKYTSKPEAIPSISKLPIRTGLDQQDFTPSNNLKESDLLPESYSVSSSDLWETSTVNGKSFEDTSSNYQWPDNHSPNNYLRS